MTHALLVFLGVFLADCFWIWYTRSAARGEVLKTGFAAVGITLLSALVVLEYTHDRAMLVRLVAHGADVSRARAHAAPTRRRASGRFSGGHFAAGLASGLAASFNMPGENHLIT